VSTTISASLTPNVYSGYKKSLFGMNY